MPNDSAEKASEKPGLLGKDTQRLNVQLDSGNQHVKYRRRFWQLWCVLFLLRLDKNLYLTHCSHRLPKDPPFPPPLSLDDAKVGSYTVGLFFH